MIIHKNTRTKTGFTDRSKDLSLNLYLKEKALRKRRLLTAEEETALVKAMKRGDPHAREKLIIANLRFVIAIAKQFEKRLPKTLTLIDLINAGNFGLITAIDRFDETRGFKIISYANLHIIHQIQEVIAEGSPVIFPLSRENQKSAIANAESDFFTRYGYWPSLHQLHQHLCFLRQNVQNAIKIEDIQLVKTIEEFVSLDGYVGNGGGIYKYKDIIPAEPTTQIGHERDISVLKTQLHQLIRTLPERHAQIICLLFGIGCNAHQREDIADMFNITKERVRQIKNEALGQLRKHKSSHRLWCTMN